MTPGDLAETAPRLPRSAVGGVRRTSYLAQSILLEEGSSPRLLRFTILLMAIAIAGAGAWASVATLDQVARTDGAVVPSSAIRVLQHLEGGIVDEVTVREGDFVREGDLVARMSPTGARSELAQLLTREASLALRLERLEAFATDREPDFAPFEERFPALVEEQRRLLTANREARSTQRVLIERQLEEARIEASGFTAQLQTILDSVTLIEEEVRLREELLQKGLTRRFTYLDALRLLNTTRGQQIQLEGLIAKSRQDIAEIETRLISFEKSVVVQALNELGTVSPELAEVRDSLTRYEDRVDRLDVHSPVSGIVQRIAVPHIGGVIPPGSTVAEIVPIGDEMIVEVMLNPKDVAFVAPGQAASVRVTAYDFAQFGAIDGHVHKVSPTTVIGPGGRSFYKVTIALGRRHLGGDPSRNLILPGMLVQADIRTGERTLVEYFAKPIQRALTTGFTER